MTDPASCSIAHCQHGCTGWCKYCEEIYESSLPTIQPLSNCVRDTVDTKDVKVPEFYSGLRRVDLPKREPTDFTQITVPMCFYQPITLHLPWWKRWYVKWKFKREWNRSFKVKL